VSPSVCLDLLGHSSEEIGADPAEEIGKDITDMPLTSMGPMGNAELRALNENLKAEVLTLRREKEALKLKLQNSESENAKLRATRQSFLGKNNIGRSNLACSMVFRNHSCLANCSSRCSPLLTLSKSQKFQTTLSNRSQISGSNLN
jgi:hypothetical protein